MNNLWTYHTLHYSTLMQFVNGLFTNSLKINGFFTKNTLNFELHLPIKGDMQVFIGQGCDAAAPGGAG